MAAVYSQLLWQAAGLSPGTYSSDVVPDGFVWVVRDLVVIIDATDSLLLQGFFIVDTAGVPRWTWPRPYVRANVDYHWSGHQVLETGDQLTMTSADDSTSWAMSGYQLTLP